MAETTHILCTQEDESPERGSGKKFTRWLTPSLTLCESGFTLMSFQGRQVGRMQYPGQQAVFCSFMQLACDKKAFIHQLVQGWLFLSKLWLVVCSQVNGIS